MPEHSIEELLGQLPAPSTPNAEFEARLRSRLTAEWHARPDTAAGHSLHPSQFSDTEVIELQTLTEIPIEPPKPRRHLLQAAAVVAVIAGAVAVLIAVQRDDENPATNPTPQTTPTPTVATTEPPPPTTASLTTPPSTTPEPALSFVGSTLDTFQVDLANNPYFVAAADEIWVASLAGELVRLDPETGAVVAQATIPESSPFAVDANAVWVADAIGGDVIRLDPANGVEVARIPTGVEILPNSYRQPMLPGTARSFAQVGGIVSDGDAVWVGDKAGAVMRIDPATNTITATFEVPVRPDLLRLDGERLLAVDQLGGKAAVIDTIQGTVVHGVTGLDDIAGAALSGGALYLQDRATGTVTRTDLASGEERTSAAVGAPTERSGDPTLPTGLVVSDAGVLVDTKSTSGNIHILDTVTLDEVGTLTTAADQGDMTVAGDGSVWLVRSLANEVVHITPTAL